MKNILYFSILVFAIMGFALLPMQQDAFAKKDDNNGKAKGCENSNEKIKAREKNPHCETDIDVTVTALARIAGFPPLVDGTCTITQSPSQEVFETQLDENGMTTFSVSADTTSIDVDCLGTAPNGWTCGSAGTFLIDPEDTNEFVAVGIGCI